MPPLYFPLRWESTGDQWWYASPIDWAAANGHYELVRELLRLDGNHLIKLTSLRRIRRLETVWGNEDHFDDVAFHRSRVAQKLFLECESKKGKNSLLRNGYGGWLLYTAASAGDLGFVKVLLERDPLLVFGEGEFGVTDVLYAAARSKKYEVFKVIYDFAASPRFMSGDGKELVERIGEVPSGYKWEMINRGVHAAARGGNLSILKDLLADTYNILSYRDNQGSTILHAAASRGQVQVVKYLIASYDDIINSTDKKGNTALHAAAYRGQLAVVEALIQASPSSVHSKNDNGETFLHTAITGFQTPSFRRIDRQIQLMKQLVHSNTSNIDEIINATNDEHRTALHLAIIGNIHSDLVDLLTSIKSIDVNIRDMHGMTPLDLIKERPHNSSSEILTRRLISAGGIFACHDYSTRKIIASHLRRQSIGSSPGTSFRISDARLFLYTGIEYTSDGNVPSGTDESIELSQPIRSPRKSKRLGSVNYATEKLKRLINWPNMKHRNKERMKKLLDSTKEEAPISLRERYSNSKPSSSIASNKRTLAVRSNLSSPKAKKMKINSVRRRSSRSSSFSRSSASSWDTNLGILAGQSFDVEGRNEGEGEDGPVKRKVNVNRYLCFGSSIGPSLRAARCVDP